METWSILLCGLLIASGVLSSATDDIKDFGKKPLKGLVVDLSPASLDILGGNVTLYFHFPSNFSGFSNSRTLSVLVYDDNIVKRRHIENVVLDRREISVILPCEIFDHPVVYRFKYRISDSRFEAFISQTLTLKWGEIRLQTPTNHTALTRFGSLWIRHNRKCLPKNRDELNLYYIKGHEKIFVTRKYIRKLSNGRQRKPEGSWIRMGFPCEVFDTQGIYRFEYQTGFENLTLAKSESIHVYWGQQTLSTPTSTIFPCTNSFVILYAQPRCQNVRTHDAIVMGDRYSKKPTAQKPVENVYDAAFFPCSLFKDYVKEYCFHYVTKSSLTKSTVRVTSLCLPSHPPGTSNYDGWSTWSSWGLCSSSCGQGKQHRYRFCTSVSTSVDKESTCAGKALMSRSCALNPCPVSGSACSCGCRLTEPHGMITSSPQLFPRPGRSSCTWVITLPQGHRVHLWFDALKMDGDSIIVRDGNDSSAPKITIIKSDDYKESIVSSGNNMYLFYKHNGHWTNGTRRGFTASYKTESRTEKSEAVAVVQRKTLGKSELTFLGVFVFAVLVFAVLLFIVFTKLRRHHKLLPPSSGGSSSTSESTLRSTGTSSPLDDEASSSEPLKNVHKQRTKSDRRRSSHRKRPRRTEFLCDADRVPRCTCGEISELDSVSGSNSASDFSPVKVTNTVERVLVRNNIECDCPDCLRYERYAVSGCAEFRAPEKKYYGDWMLTEMPAETPCYTDQRIYRDACKGFV
ncbi:uncharacterized protein LOC110056806 isoform X2 [Orbicella faveolata]|nr:uncharacterized protein LOC110056806 isoform X2 [Orbicella faveolata]XP_020619011.1 uncharacterized protein LOC110056806 isoform X2 [Orbicella faveolata]XP_020619012.1 uncharacterized protein LOC110056806 isoform X2 [Orbicella faveolata]